MRVLSQEISLGNLLPVTEMDTVVAQRPIYSLAKVSHGSKQSTVIELYAVPPT